MRGRGTGKECLDAICVQAQPASARIARVLGEIPQTPCKHTAYSAGILVKYYLRGIIARIMSRLSLAPKPPLGKVLPVSVCMGVDKGERGVV